MLLLWGNHFQVRISLRSLQKAEGVVKKKNKITAANLNRRTVKSSLRTRRTRDEAARTSGFSLTPTEAHHRTKEKQKTCTLWLFFIIICIKGYYETLSILHCNCSVDAMRFRDALCATNVCVCVLWIPSPIYWRTDCKNHRRLGVCRNVRTAQRTRETLTNRSNLAAALLFTRPRSGFACYSFWIKWA